MTHKYYCEFPSGNGVIFVKFETGNPNDIAQTWPIRLNPEMKTEQLVWQPILKEPQSPSTQGLTVTEFAPTWQERLNDWLKAIKLVYDESNNLELLFNRLATTEQRSIDEFIDFGMLFECPEAKEQIKDLNIDGMELCIVEYAKFLHLIYYHMGELEKLFDSYLTAIQKLTDKTCNLRKLLNRCLTVTDIQQPINPNILKKLNNYLVIQSFQHLTIVNMVLSEYLEAYEMTECNINVLRSFLFPVNVDSFRKLVICVPKALGLLKGHHRPIMNQHILRFRNDIQDLLKSYSTALSKTNDIQ
jgi:hypothetical protein